MALGHCVCACDACPRAEGIHSNTFSKYVHWLKHWKGLYAVHRTETRGPRLGVICNSGEPRAARRQGQRWDVIHHARYRPCTTWGTGTVCRASLGPLQYLVQWVPRSVCPGIVSRSVKLTAHVQSVEIKKYLSNITTSPSVSSSASNILLNTFFPISFQSSYRIS